GKRVRSSGVMRLVFTQRRKDRKGAKAGQIPLCVTKNLTRLCAFAIFASLRESFSWRVWLSVELVVQPSEYTCFGGAERLNPAVEQKFGAAALEGDLLRFLHDRAAAFQIQFVCIRSCFVGLRRHVESPEKLAYPLVQAALGRVVSERLNDPDRESILSTIELKDLFALRLHVLLFPLEHFFDRRVPDDCDSLIVVEEPLDHIRN